MLKCMGEVIFMSLKEKTKKYLNKKCKNSIKGKTIVITGATSGVGLKAAEELLYLGANLILAARNQEKAEEIKKNLEEEYEDSTIDIYPLDLASLDSIKKFAARIKRNKVDVYGFVNNAGVFSGNNRTVDNYPLVMGTNYIGTFVLVERLLPYFMSLSHDVKLINTSSISYKSGKINYNDFFFEKKKKGTFQIYSRSKLCLTKYSIYLANKYMDSNIQTIMTHPGIAKTSLLMDMFKPWYMRIFKPMANIFMKPEKASLSIPYALTNDVRSGSLIGPNHAFDGWGYPKINKLKKKAYSEIEQLIVYTKGIVKKDI